MSLTKVVNSSASHGKSELTRVDYLDGWRGLAIIFVLQSHFFVIPEINTGDLGVDIFFVLSGFLMSRILFVKRVPLSTFYKRRISRILPVFVLFILTIYGIAYVINRNHAELGNIFYTLTFLRTYLPETPNLWHTGLPIGHLWSLNVEEHSYVFLSLLTLLAWLKGREGIALIMAGTMTILIHLMYIRMPEIAPHTMDIRTETVACFILLSAGYYLIRETFVPYVQSWMPVCTFILAVACYTVYAPWWAPIILSPYLLAFTVNHLSEIPRFLQSALSTAPIRLMGIWSYSIYLWQHPVFKNKEYFGTGYDLIALMIAILLGVMSFYLYENPTRTWLNKKW